MSPVSKMLIDMARFYGFDLDKRRLEMYADVLGQWDESLVLAAGKRYVQNPKNDRFPIPPHKILADMLPQSAEPRDMAVHTAGRIREAVRKFGWPSPRLAREHIGEAGWTVVERFGGWQHLCENLGVEIQETTFLAQCRDAVQAEINLQKSGIDTSHPALEQTKAKNVQGSEKVVELVSSTLAKKEEL